MTSLHLHLLIAGTIAFAIVPSVMCHDYDLSIPCGPQGGFTLSVEANGPLICSVTGTMLMVCMRDSPDICIGQEIDP